MIDTWRKKARAKALEIGPPRPKQEAFQYLPFALLDLGVQVAGPGTIESIDAYLLPELDHCLVFIDGFFSPHHSSLPKDIVCLSLPVALQSYGLFIQNRWARTLKEERDPFALQNAAEHGLGAFIYAPPRTQAKLHILQIFTTDALASPRLDITLGQGADLTLVETYVSQHTHSSANSAIDFTLDAGAKVRFLDVQLLGPSMRAFTSVKATLKRDASFDALSITDGAAVARSTFAVELSEENSSLSLKGLSLLTGERHSHIHALVDHAAPHSTSRQHFKMALSGKSQSSFEGKIYVRPIAQKTMAYQLNNNLLLGEGSRANSKPNLEIFADDVKASHGSTMTQLSSEELFYLRSRGLTAGDAQALLAHGFCKELLDGVEIESLRAPLEQVMHKVLGHDAL
jgi:Fe-S cluster assembly protein SufD